MATSWSYVPNDTYKPAEEIIEKLVDIVSKGGNYLLNIGPGPDGQLDPNAYIRLKQIGAWMKINGEAIYGSRMYAVNNESDSIHFTQSKDKKMQFVFLSSFPDKKVLLTKLAIENNATIKMLGSNKKLTWKRKGSVVEIEIPAAMKKLTDYVWVLKVAEP